MMFNDIMAEDSAKQIRDKWNKVGIDVSYYASKKNAVLSRLFVPKNMRNKGFAKQAMNEIISHADTYGLVIRLSPTSEWGASKSRLINFYKKFGFVENKGKNRYFEISETMYRNPIQTEL